jgi:Acyltransferase
MTTVLALLARAGIEAPPAPLLARGQVVVYPEGTRAVDNGIGRFHSGALQLARDLDIPLVPVALVGTHRCCRSTDGSPPAARTSVRLYARRKRPGRSRCGGYAAACRPTARHGDGTYRLARMQFVAGRVVLLSSALVIAFAWGVAEALSWPVIAEMSLVLFAVAVPRRVLPWLARSPPVPSPVSRCVPDWQHAERLGRRHWRRRPCVAPRPNTSPRDRGVAILFRQRLCLMSLQGGAMSAPEVFGERIYAERSSLDIPSQFGSKARTCPTCSASSAFSCLRTLVAAGCTARDRGGSSSWFAARCGTSAGWCCCTGT